MYTPVSTTAQSKQGYATHTNKNKKKNPATCSVVQTQSKGGGGLDLNSKGLSELVS